jgi:hypothetical protein
MFSIEAMKIEQTRSAFRMTQASLWRGMSRNAFSIYTRRLHYELQVEAGKAGAVWQRLRTPAAVNC